MKKFLVLILVLSALWFNFTSPAKADFAQLTPCGESPAYQAKAESFLNTTADPESGKKRAERYAEALCGEEGYPHLIVDGRWSKAGDFLIPSILFLYIAGWIGWVGRSYLIEIKKDKNPEMKEITIDVPLAIRTMMFGFLWPVQAIPQMLSGEMFAKDSEIPISPR